MPPSEREAAAAPPLPEAVRGPHASLPEGGGSGPAADGRSLPRHLKVMSEKTGFAARSFLMPCRHSGRSLASPSPGAKAKPSAAGLLWRGGTAEQVSFRIHPEANAAKLVPTRSCCLQTAACPRRENRKQDVSCRPACTKKSRLPAALHAASIAHRSVPFHAILRRRRSCGTSGTTGTAFFQKHLNTPIYRIYPVLYTLI